MIGARWPIAIPRLGVSPAGVVTVGGARSHRLCGGVRRLSMIGARGDCHFSAGVFPDGFRIAGAPPEPLFVRGHSRTVHDWCSVADCHSSAASSSKALLPSVVAEPPFERGVRRLSTIGARWSIAFSAEFSPDGVTTVGGAVGATVSFGRTSVRDSHCVLRLVVRHAPATLSDECLLIGELMEPVWNPQLSTCPEAPAEREISWEPNSTVAESGYPSRPAAGWLCCAWLVVVQKISEQRGAASCHNDAIDHFGPWLRNMFAL